MTPPHYLANGQDVFSILPSLYSLNHISDPLLAFYYGNALKYLWRFNAKGQPNSDLLKCVDYIEHIIRRLEELE